MQEVKVQILKYTPATSLTIISQGRIISIPFEEIIHIYKDKDRTVIVTKNEEYRCTAKLYRLERELPVNDFIRVNLSSIVALEYWEELKKSIPLSAHYKKLLREQFKNRMDSHYRTILYRPL